MKKKIPTKDIIVFAVIMIVAGCFDPEGSIGQFFLDPNTKKGIDAATGFGSMFGPVGTAAGSGIAALYAVGRSYFVSKKANKDKDSMGKEAMRLEAAFSGLVEGVQRAKQDLPPQQYKQLKEGLISHTPDWVREKVDEVRGKSQKYLGE